MVDTGQDPAGFWLGLWQGLISLITFLISLFTSEVNIYEVQNKATGNVTSASSWAWRCVRRRRWR